LPVIRRRISRYPPDEIRFNLIAMRKDPRVQAKEIGDMETLRNEERKRSEWQWENALRRHNFVGFIGELMKGVVRSKLKEGDKAYDAWVEAAKAKTKARMEERRKKGAAADEMDV
jgi:ubiquitin carboxyl-terminal hydrolase L5